MSFRAVFIALVIATGLIVAAFLINWRRPAGDTGQRSKEGIRATGKCAECHAREQFSVVHEYELSAHAKKNVTCLECHQPAKGQDGKDHHGFTITTKMTAGNCRSCHETVYQQFTRSRHAAPAWASVYGDKDFTAEQVAHSEKFHPGGCKRAPSPLVGLEGGPAAVAGCSACHSVGRPNSDGTIGTCTACHSRHNSSVALARLPTTCGQCHMGPDHSQIEIYEESKHGVMFQAQKNLLNLEADPMSLSTRDMFIPTCATCHMSRLNRAAVTHDTSERLSYYLFAEVSDKRPGYVQAQIKMKEICLSCHTQATVDKVYDDAEKVVGSTNEKILAVKGIVDGLRKDGLIPKQPFATPLDFEYFDLWHYYGRTAKHGAFMGGADFVQWHGNYPILKHTIEIKAKAAALRAGKAEK